MPDDRGVAGVLAAALREQRERTLPPLPDDPHAGWHPFQLRDKAAEPEPDAAPVVAPSYSISAIADAYRQRTMAATDDTAAEP